MFKIKNELNLIAFDFMVVIPLKDIFIFSFFLVKYSEIIDWLREKTSFI